MLPTVLGSHISLELDIAEQPLAVEADANQFENVMVIWWPTRGMQWMARGSLSIRLARAQNSDATGDFVTVAVRDTGCGIPANQIDKIFEPFFTTKPVGRGTGLGLSQVYGFVQQSDGKVTVDSTVGVGTTITLYLPLSSKPIQPKRDGRSASTELRIRARVLVVEDTHRSVNSPRNFFSILAMRPCLRPMRKRRCNSLRRNRVASTSSLAMW